MAKLNYTSYSNKNTYGEANMTKIIAFSNQKGGVGKTSTCVNMAAALALKGKRVLLIDMDPQGNATTGLGFSKSELKTSVYNVLIDEIPVKNAILNTQIKNLDILPSSIDLAGAEVELVYVKNREKRLDSALKNIDNTYDFIAIDCPPSLGLLTVNALAASDGVVIPIQSEYYAMEGLTQLMNTIKIVVEHLNQRLHIEGIVITMYDGRALVSKQISAEIHKFFGKKMFNTVVPRNIRVSEAPSHGVPVMLHDPKCNGAKAYIALAEEFLRREN